MSIPDHSVYPLIAIYCGASRHKGSYTFDASPAVKPVNFDIDQISVALHQNAEEWMHDVETADGAFEYLYRTFHGEYLPQRGNCD